MGWPYEHLQDDGESAEKDSKQMEAEAKHAAKALEARDKLDAGQVP